jgi:endonuclease/exonuclease/phosphatase family metal-dependent hydrolase
MAVALCACAAAVNYVDPTGPKYTGGAGVVTDPDSAIRIVSFNIAHGRHVERAIACFGVPPLRGADLVLLQEMDASGVETLSSALAMNFVYYPSSYRPGQRDMGNAVLSPWPIEAAEKLLLPHTSRLVHRGRSATVATVRIEGVVVRVYSLHLGSPLGLSGRKRGEQAQAVLAHLRAWDGPLVVGGDLNSRSVGERFEEAGFRWLTRSVGRTIGPFSFDHIFVRGLPPPAQAGVARMCPGVSDHAPVWALARPGR